MKVTINVSVEGIPPCCMKRVTLVSEPWSMERGLGALSAEDKLLEAMVASDVPRMVRTLVERFHATKDAEPVEYKGSKPEGEATLTAAKPARKGKGSNGG